MRFLLVALLVLAPQVFAQTAPLNDTGQTLCFQGGALAACTVANTGNESSHPRQDGRFGRDPKAAAGDLTKIGAGAAGFDFTRICNSGETTGTGACPADAALGAGDNHWACTRDNVTGLIWEVKTLANKDTTFSFANAPNFAATVNAAQLCGSTNWRVPTHRELLSIVHHGVMNPSIDTTFFPNTAAQAYWSSDIDARNPAAAWFVWFGDGDSFSFIQTHGSRVRLVAGALAVPAFAVNPDGTVTDPATGLMWDRCSWGQTRIGDTNGCDGVASTHTWQAALGIAVTANAANDGAGHRGYTDWRLPNRTELESLVDITKATAPTVDSVAFPNTPSGFFRSSTVYTPNPSFAWEINFEGADTSAGHQRFDFNVRLVRSGQPFDDLVPAAPTHQPAQASVPLLE